MNDFLSIKKNEKLAFRRHIFLPLLIKTPPSSLILKNIHP